MEQNVDQVLDLAGLRCPLPLLRAKQVMNALSSGQILKVIATDPASARDFASYAKLSGHRLLFSEERSGQFVHILQHR